MPSASHEIIRAVFASNRRMLVELLDKLLVEQGVPVLAQVQDLQQYPAETITLTTREHRADLVFIVRDLQGITQRVIVLEIQLGQDEEKLFTWPHYTTTFRLRHRCPCDLVVVTPFDQVARWANQQVRLDTRNTYQPLILGPELIPVITDEEQAKACIESALLSVLAHGRTENGCAVGHAALLALHALDQLDEDLRVLYYDVIRKALPTAVLRDLEELMSLQGIEFESDFAKHYVDLGREEGREEGRAQATAENVFRILTSRNLPLTDAQRNRVLSCRDLSTLEHWFDRALQIDDVDELFD